MEKEDQTIPIDYNTILSGLFSKYADHPYMTSRLVNHIANILPSTLENEYKNYEKRLVRLNSLTTEQHTFIQVFLDKNKYYYLPSLGSFYEYDGKTYSIIKEDDIQHKLLSSISYDRTLMDWKYKTKVNIIKQIKDRHLFKCIPETETIQSVIQLLVPAVFSTKNQAKYFLIVLGDNLLKKTNDLVFIINNAGKHLLSEINSCSTLFTGYTNIVSNIMLKYHINYDYQKCRLLKVTDIKYNELWKSNLKSMGLDLICVATHYSRRYNNSDDFLSQTPDDDEFKQYTLSLTLNTSQNILDQFCEHSINKVSNTEEQLVCSTNNNLNMSWKKMYYVWKLYLARKCLPNVIYSNTVKNMLKYRYEYDEITDSFKNINSKFLPVVGDFIRFSHNTIVLLPKDVVNSNNDIIEIEELCVLFKRWHNINSSLVSSSGNISETEVLKILIHFFPEINIEDNKFVFNIKCTLWDKQDDINSVLPFLNDLYREKTSKEEEKPLISLDEAYAYYCKFSMKKNPGYKPICLVSKKYFENHLSTILKPFILFDKFISNEWYSVPFLGSNVIESL